MTSANYLDWYLRALAEDRKLASKAHRILHRAHALNIDFREPARRSLRSEAALLAGRLEQRFRQLRTIDLSLVDSAGSTFEIAARARVNLGIARTMADLFRRAVEEAFVLDAEQEPRLGILPELLSCLERTATEMIRLAGILTEAERKVTRPLRVSQQLANLAARLLPWEQRERYLNEYLSELDELVQDSLSRRAQLRHALRLLVRTPALRLALRAPAQEEHLPMTTESR